MPLDMSRTVSEIKDTYRSILIHVIKHIKTMSEIRIHMGVFSLIRTFILRLQN